MVCTQRFAVVGPASFVTCICQSRTAAGEPDISASGHLPHCGIRYNRDRLRTFPAHLAGFPRRSDWRTRWAKYSSIASANLAADLLPGSIRSAAIRPAIFSASFRASATFSAGQCPSILHVVERVPCLRCSMKKNHDMRRTPIRSRRPTTPVSRKVPRISNSRSASMLASEKRRGFTAVGDLIDISSATPDLRRPIPRPWTPGD